MAPQVFDRDVVFLCHRALDTQHSEQPDELTVAMSASDFGKGVVISASLKPAGNPVANALQRSIMQTHQLTSVNIPPVTLTMSTHARQARLHPRKVAVETSCFSEMVFWSDRIGRSRMGSGEDQLTPQVYSVSEESRSMAHLTANPAKSQPGDQHRKGSI